MYTEYFQHFRRSCPDLLHFAAHSHHPWPDVTRAAQLAYWELSNSQLDRKWRTIFGELIPEVQLLLAQELDLSDHKSLCFAPNTHEFVARLLSCFHERDRFLVLTTDSEFHSFRRQIDRYRELSAVTVQCVPVAPFDTFSTRFFETAQNSGVQWDLIFCSHVFFLSGYAVPQLADLAKALAPLCRALVIDGYHSFQALPLSLRPVEERMYFLAGGYKYAQSGEGACFMHVPSSCDLRPLNTGWFAELETLENDHSSGKVAFGKGAERFWGATFDASGLHRMHAVLKLFQDKQISTATRLAYVRKLQSYFLSKLAERKKNFPLKPNQLLLEDLNAIGHFLAFKLNNARELQQDWEKQGIQVDVRGDVLRVGFGIYQTEEDIRELFHRVG